jgi:hypothetical protein
MNNFFWIFVAISSIFSTGLFADDDDDKPGNPIPANSAKVMKDQTGIFLDKTAEAIAGIKTTKLKPSTYRSELRTYGTAISVEPLLAIQNQYLNALAQQQSAEAKAKFSKSSLNRLTYLHNEQIVSTHALQNQQATWQADKAALASSHYLTQQIINNARLIWGQRLTDWLINRNAALNALMQQQTTLLKITVPQQENLATPKTIFVAAMGQRKQAVTAAFISNVPQTDNFSQGLQYFYQVSAQHIKAGMRVNAWMPTEHNQTGVIIPESALLWHLGQALVFIKTPEQQFIHRSISTYTKIDRGYFVNSGLKPGEEVVTAGAQMLLSQEFKGQIPNEDDD